ncbi:DUF6924 domain-containing protein [Micromonospora zhanjiangensis]|uniref:DUF6924 domain-containing protein n=1 Tax=Micromonospora zhanjiangensis TaxID=1522057 RepID=A0ABV8KE42_9ACTN
MTSQPVTYGAPILRTDFSADSAWAALCAAVAGAADDGEGPDCVSDPEYDGLTVEELVAVGRDDRDCAYAFVADRRTMTDPELSVLVVDLDREPGRTFRAVPAALIAIDDALSASGVDFHRYAESADADGVLRVLR